MLHAGIPKWPGIHMLMMVAAVCSMPALAEPCTGKQCIADESVLLQVNLHTFNGGQAHSDFVQAASGNMAGDEDMLQSKEEEEKEALLQATVKEEVKENEKAEEGEMTKAEEGVERLLQRLGEEGAARLMQRIGEQVRLVSGPPKYQDFLAAFVGKEFKNAVADQADKRAVEDGRKASKWNLRPKKGQAEEMVLDIREGDVVKQTMIVPFKKTSINKLKRPASMSGWYGFTVKGDDKTHIKKPRYEIIVGMKDAQRGVFITDTTRGKQGHHWTSKDHTSVGLWTAAPTGKAQGKKESAAAATRKAQDKKKSAAPGEEDEARASSAAASGDSSFNSGALMSDDQSEDQNGNVRPEALQLCAVIASEMGMEPNEGFVNSLIRFAALLLLQLNEDATEPNIIAVLSELAKQIGNA
eukprot:gnl/TRDRNA2_/TRDRNA2_136133_c0_seq1.p1 gnl/TRDRNA2_/TRDRNA2_136133_c0~~gnl/TRDRNA2_/TRDRNA2_136133_c0_seq1.p1  ORF type:complete len:412 (-),score=88.46 gnl/TRDRNA2_/TRDRNA2_136133_c0_seq1:41-1276(-)